MKVSDIIKVEGMNRRQWSLKEGFFPGRYKATLVGTEVHSWGDTRQEAQENLLEVLRDRLKRLNRFEPLYIYKPPFIYCVYRATPCLDLVIQVIPSKTRNTVEKGSVVKRMSTIPNLATILTVIDEHFMANL